MEVAAWCLVLSPDQRQAARYSLGEVHLLDLADPPGPTWKLGNRLGGDAVSALAYSPDGRVLYAPHFGVLHLQGRRFRVRRWSLPEGRAMESIKVPGYVATLAVSLDGARLATIGGGDDRFVRVFAADTGKLIWEHEHGAASTPRVAFAPDGSLLAGVVGKAVGVWAADTGEARHLLKGHAAQVNDLAFTPDGRRVLSVSHDGSARVWDLAAGGEARTFAWGVGKLTAVAVAPDGLTAAAGGERGHIVTWDLG
jgi:WD40 repeat protein